MVDLKRLKELNERARLSLREAQVPVDEMNTLLKQVEKKQRRKAKWRHCELKRLGIFGLRG